MLTAIAPKTAKNQKRTRNVFILPALLALSILKFQLTAAFAQGTAFTYQGQLQNNGSLASGTYNLTFSLYTNVTDGTMVAGPVTNNGVAITNGLFTVTIDFGASVWNGQTNWLQIGVESNKNATFTTLAPRQQVTPIPYAIAAEGLDGTLPASQLTSIGNNNGGFNNFFTGPSGNATTSGDFNTAIGNQALNDNTSGSDNSANGYSALASNTSGRDNTANGVDALYDNTIGSENTAIGLQALSFDTVGSNNIALGYQAGFNISGGSFNIDIGNKGSFNDTNIIRIGTGQTATYLAGTIYGNGGGLTNINVIASQLTSIGNSNGGIDNFFVGPAGNAANSGTLNTAIGFGALTNNTSGSENTANGTYALYHNITGQDNTAVGVRALVANTNGNDNTACGASALNLNSYGSDNTAVGYDSLFLNNSGGLNTASGFQALIRNQIGSDNTADGADALIANVIGSMNTAVGYNALNALGNTTEEGGVDNIALGAEAGSALDGDEYDDIDIGNTGVAGENLIIRIGTPGIQSAAYIAGVIYGNGGGLTNLSLSAAQLVSAGNNNGGFDNFFVGPSGNATTSGNGNTAIGLDALVSNTSGNDNTADGMDALVENTTGFENTAIGIQALEFNTSGLQNTAIGVDALVVNTTGFENTANGMQALANNTSGYYNTADGVVALALNTNGWGNTADGAYALFFNTSGSNNVALGYQAGYNITTGSSNIDIGNEGLSTDNTTIRIGTPGIQSAAYIAGEITGDGGGLTNLNASQLTSVSSGLGNFFVGPSGNDTTTGDQNVAMGVEALAKNTSGASNTANGAFALEYNTSGWGNTAIGWSALFNNTIGIQNTAIGMMALIENTTGSDNSANGLYALLSNTTGNNNTAFGSAALINNTTGSNNVALGYYAGSALTNNESSNIDIGNPGLAGESSVIRIGTTQTATYLVGTVYANGVALTSDRNAKENFSSINTRALLDKVASLPITEWNYKTDKTAEHIGPMAQDFKAAFGLDGPDDKHISVVDEGGVALAAVQGLNQKLEEQTKEKDAEIADLKKQNDSLTQRLDELEQTVKLLAQRN